mmetsp:Transcript_38601/g.81935  ORF Transcript_38601/g.81935 Transcript_38601/m.81935 type:complete len:266 (+) Transcript_38601:893-1690(+)
MAASGGPVAQLGPVVLGKGLGWGSHILINAPIEHKVHIRPTEATGGNTTEACLIPVFHRLGRENQRCLCDVQVRVQLPKMDIGDDHTPADRIGRLAEVHDAASFDGVAQVGLDAAELQHLLGCAISQSPAARGDFDCISHGLALAVALDEVDVVGHDARLPARFLQDRLLRGPIGGRHACGAAAVHGGSSHDGHHERQVVLHGDAVLQLILLRSDRRSTDRFVANVPVGRCIVRQSPALVAQEARSAVRRPPSLGNDHVHADAAG